MKLISFFLILFSLNVCTDKTAKKQDDNHLAKPIICYFNNKGKPLVTWTFYKTTAKKPLVFRFDKTSITETKSANDPLAVYPNAIVTLDTKRILEDDKPNTIISEYLFGKMMASNTVSIQITRFDVATQEVFVKVNMNNTSKTLKAHFDKKEKQLIITGVFDLKKDFNAGEALYFYHTAEFDNHKGADGKSKTWSEVRFQIKLQLDMKC